MKIYHLILSYGKLPLIMHFATHRSAARSVLIKAMKVHYSTITSGLKNIELKIQREGRMYKNILYKVAFCLRETI